MKPINTSTFDFPTMIQRGFVYVDKTRQIYELVRQDTDSIYFFPRPRRFGKSLLISTLKALFQGRRELFKGLAIDKIKAWDWKHEVYPVLHLDMSDAASSEAATLNTKLNLMMKASCENFGVEYDSALPASGNFLNLLNALPKVARRGKSKKDLARPDAGRYVLLIDEYDAPIAKMLDAPEKRAELAKIREALHDFYIVAKSHCGDMRFLMVTGVSKFAKTSIFSAFNNPKDLSLDARAADLVGYTHEELEKYFHDHIAAFAKKRGLAYAQMFDELLSWYDSYQFSPEDLVKVVNPVSVGNALSSQVIKGWWEATAGSTLIYDALKAANKAPFDFADAFSVSTLDAPDALEAPTAALLYQGGYLTIDRRINDRMLYLKIPNHEVRQSLETGYMSRLLGKDFEIDAMQLTAEETAARLASEGYTDTLKTMLQSAFSRLPHDWLDKDKTQIKRYFLAFMIFANAEVAGEPQHAPGRPDAVMRTDKGIYIFEFKYAKSAKAAIKQCYERNYAAACTDVTRSDLLNGKYGDYETSFQRIASHFKTSLTDVLIWTGVTNGTVYKTSKLVMRKIPAKDVVWTIGSPDGEKGKDYSGEGGREDQHTVKLTEDFYIGVFELTQYQYSLCPGSEDGPHYTGYSNSDIRPAEYIRPRELRGWQDLAGQTHSSEKIMWPTNSYQHDVYNNRVFGKMRSKFGVDFDLPTEAQWEFACRAGTTTGLNSGYDITICDSAGTRCPRVDEVCWNQSSDYSAVEPTGTPHTMPVGMKKPNAYGLYDMHGNVEEVCQDFMYNDITTYWDKDPEDGLYKNLAHTDTAENPLIDPVGRYNSSGNNGYTTARGGSYDKNNRYVRSAHRESGHKYSNKYYYQGYRLACPVGAHWIEANRNK